MDTNNLFDQKEKKEIEEDINQEKISDNHFSISNFLIHLLFVLLIIGFLITLPFLWLNASFSSNQEEAILMFFGALAGFVIVIGLYVSWTVKQLKNISKVSVQKTYITLTVFMVLAVIGIFAFLMYQGKKSERLKQEWYEVQKIEKENQERRNASKVQRENDSEKKMGLAKESEIEDDELKNADEKINDIWTEGNWKKYVKNNEYEISFPNQLMVTYDNLDFVNIEEIKNDSNNLDGVRFKIVTRDVGSGPLNIPNFKSSADHRDYLLNNDIPGKKRAIDVAADFDYISLFQETVRSMGGASVSYFAYGSDGMYYEIQIFEPAYSNNKNLIESIMKTFTIF